MHARHDPRTPVVHRDVGQGYPAGEVLLRLDVRVAVVLVPGKALRLLGLLVDRLVPVEPYVRPDQIVPEIPEGPPAAERAQDGRTLHQVDAEGDGVSVRNERAAAWEAAQHGRDARLERIDLVDHRADRNRVEGILQ